MALKIARNWLKKKSREILIEKVLVKSEDIFRIIGSKGLHDIISIGQQEKLLKLLVNQKIYNIRENSLSLKLRGSFNMLMKAPDFPVKVNTTKTNIFEALLEAAENQKIYEDFFLERLKFIPKNRKKINKIKEIIKTVEKYIGVPKDEANDIDYFLNFELSDKFFEAEKISNLYKNFIDRLKSLKEINKKKGFFSFFTYAYSKIKTCSKVVYSFIKNNPKILIILLGSVFVCLLLFLINLRNKNKNSLYKTKQFNRKT